MKCDWHPLSTYFPLFFSASSDRIQHTNVVIDHTGITKIHASGDKTPNHALNNTRKEKNHQHVVIVRYLTRIIWSSQKNQTHKKSQIRKPRPESAQSWQMAWNSEQSSHRLCLHNFPFIVSHNSVWKNKKPRKYVYGANWLGTLLSRIILVAFVSLPRLWGCCCFSC